MTLVIFKSTQTV